MDRWMSIKKNSTWKKNESFSAAAKLSLHEKHALLKTFFISPQKDILKFLSHD